MSSSYAGLGGGGGLGLIGLNMVMGPNSSSSRKGRVKRSGSKSSRTTEDGQKTGAHQTDSHGIHDACQSLEEGRSPLGSGVLQWKNGKQYLAYSPQEIPYPRSYDRIAIDHDTTNYLFLNHLCNGLTWHNFRPNPNELSTSSSSSNKEPQSSIGSSKSRNETKTGSMSWIPDNVLDLGCGNGVWILDAAKLWPNTMFTGLDIAPIQPNISFLAPSLANRIQWTNANFLEQLPFPTSHFDFVRICRIARGVPEHKWKELFAEVSRVLKPSGALEVFEEDLIFPGDAEMVPSHPPLVAKSNNVEDTAGSSLENLPSSSNASTIRYRNTISSLEQVYKDMHHDRRISLHPISIISNVLPTYFHEIQNHPPIFMTFPPPEEDIWSDSSSSASDSDMSAGSRRMIKRNEVERERNRRPVSYRSSTISRLSTIASSIAYSMGSSGVDSSASGSPPQLSPQELHADGTQREASDNNTSGTSWPTSTVNHRLQEYASDQAIADVNIFTKAPVHRSKLNVTDSKSMAGAYSISFRNPVCNMDLHSLTLSLALSVTDVLECKESIWDFMMQTGHSNPLKQTPHLHRAMNESASTDGHNGEKESPPTNRRRSHSDPSSRPRLSIDTTSDRRVITREEFDRWFLDYEQEMHKRLQMAKALQSRLNWRTRALMSAVESGLTTPQHFISRSNSAPLARKSSSSSSLATGDIIRLPRRPSSEWPFTLTLSDAESGGTESPPFPNSSSVSLWYDERNSEGEGTVESSPENVSQQSSMKGRYPSRSEMTNNDLPQRQSPPKTKERRGQSHIRSHAGEYHPRRLRTRHSRGYSLDAANAWELLAQENSHLGSLSLGAKPILRSAHTAKPSSKNKNDIWNEHLPSLSRCVKVFVALNSKAE